MNDNSQSLAWDAEQWLKEFDAASKSRNTHGPRRKVFESTLRIIGAGCYVNHNGNRIELADLWNDQPLRSNVFCEREISLHKPEHKYATVVKVAGSDCLAYARTLLEQDSTPDVCVLNMASPSNPGGGVYSGAGAQEEYLFRCSDYMRFIYQYANRNHFDCEKVYGIPSNPHHHYPLKGDFGGVFSRGVTVFRDTERRGYALLDEPWQVNFVAVAALYVKHGKPRNYVASTMNRIRTILRIAYNNGQRRLVLGAFGCGAFGNDPHDMATLFEQVIGEPEFNGIFAEIHFAIIEDHNSRSRNYDAFNTIFNHKH